MKVVDPSVTPEADNKPERTAQVLRFAGITKHDLPADRVLHGALDAGLKCSVVLGYDADGEEYFAHARNFAVAVWRELQLQNGVSFQPVDTIKGWRAARLQRANDDEERRIHAAQEGAGNRIEDDTAGNR